MALARNLANGSRAIKPMLKAFFPVFLLCTLPFFYFTWQRVSQSRDPNGFYGDRMGIVRIVKMVDQGNGRESQQDQGRAVLRMRFWPDYFSFLDRFKSEGVLVSDTGERQAVGARRARLWTVRWNKSASTLLSSGAQDGLLQGTWNGSYPHFEWTFDHLQNADLDASTRYVVTGELANGDQATLEKLAAEIRTTH